MKKRNKKNLNINQQSFFFEDYLSTNQKFKKENSTINEDRVYILFFLFFH